VNESRIEERIRQGVKKRGGRAYKFVSPGLAGVPDRIVLIPGGKAVFVELKAPGEELRPLQEKRAKEIQALGFEFYKIDSLAGVEEFIKEVFEK